MSIKTSLNGGDRGFLLNYIANGSVGAEVGVWRGEFSAAILAAKQPKQYHLIDAWIAYENGGGVLKSTDVAVGAEELRYQEVLEKFKDQISSGQVVVHRALSVDASHHIDNESLDWIYIDGGHTYEDVKADLNAYFNKVKVGGYIMGDDYNPNAWKGVVKAVDEFRAYPQIKTIRLDGCQFVLQRIS